MWTLTEPEGRTEPAGIAVVGVASFSVRARAAARLVGFEAISEVRSPMLSLLTTFLALRAPAAGKQMGRRAVLGAATAVVATSTIVMQPQPRYDT